MARKSRVEVRPIFPVLCGLVVLFTVLVAAACSPSPSAQPTSAPAAAAQPAKSAVQRVTLRLGSSDAEGSSSMAPNIAKFAELATQKSNGELIVQPYYQSL